jgi:beta-lactam-binding protein with PASTA domain
MWRTYPTAHGGHQPLPESIEQPFTGYRGQVETPDLVGMTTQDARRTARLAEIRLAVDEHPAEPGLRGRVISQHPLAGQYVQPADIVTITVGARPDVTVPDVRGAEEQEAMLQLRDAGLFPSRRVVRRSNAVPQGHVVRTRPRAGADVSLGTRVTLVIAAPPRPSGAHARREAKRVRAQRLPDGTFLTLPEGE